MIFHHTHVPLTKWFSSIHLIASDKGGVSALRLSKLMDEYIDEFVYRFNRRHWEYQLAQRLLEAAVAHVPIRFNTA